MPNVQKMISPDTVRPLRYCSFCGRSEDQSFIINGPSVYICNECVDLCSLILLDRFIDQEIGE